MKRCPPQNAKCMLHEECSRKVDGHLPQGPGKARRNLPRETHLRFQHFPQFPKTNKITAHDQKISKKTRHDPRRPALPPNTAGGAGVRVPGRRSAEMLEPPRRQAQRPALTSTVRPHTQAGRWPPPAETVGLGLGRGRSDGGEGAGCGAMGGGLCFRLSRESSEPG